MRRENEKTGLFQRHCPDRETDNFSQGISSMISLAAEPVKETIIHNIR